MRLFGSVSGQPRNFQSFSDCTELGALSFLKALERFSSRQMKIWLCEHYSNSITWEHDA